MAATANIALHHVRGEMSEYPQAAAKIYEGAMLGDSSGYAHGLTAGDPFIGHAAEYYDNSGGSAGDHKIQRYRGRYRLQVTLSGVLITDVGKTVFASADDTLTLTAGVNSRVGVVERYVTTDTAIVEFQTNEIEEITSDLTAVLSNLVTIGGASDLVSIQSDVTTLKSDNVVNKSNIVARQSDHTWVRSDLIWNNSDTHADKSNILVHVSDARVAISNAKLAFTAGDWVNASDVKVSVGEIIQAFSDALK